jgi:hypothetical protein
MSKASTVFWALKMVSLRIFNNFYKNYSVLIIPTIFFLFMHVKNHGIILIFKIKFLINT